MTHHTRPQRERERERERAGERRERWRTEGEGESVSAGRCPGESARRLRCSPSCAGCGGAWGRVGALLSSQRPLLVLELLGARGGAPLPRKGHGLCSAVCPPTSARMSLACSIMNISTPNMPPTDMTAMSLPHLLITSPASPSAMSPTTVKSVAPVESSRLVHITESTKPNLPVCHRNKVA